jgi:hypothetical protein
MPAITKTRPKCYRCGGPENYYREVGIMAKECIINKVEIGKAEDNVPCELCALILELGKLVNETAKQIKQLEPVIAYEKMKEEFSILNKTHTKCKGCGLCFGGHHLAFPKEVDGIGEVCQWCEEEIKKLGLKKFKARITKGGN